LRVPHAAAAIAALLVLSACGSNVDHEAVITAGNGGAPVAGAPVAGAVDPGAVAGGSVGTTGIPAATGAPAPTTGGAPVTAPGTATTAARGAVKPGSVGNAGKAQAQLGAVVDPAGAPCTKKLSPIRLGQTLAVSGVVGAAIAGMRPGTLVWAQDVNARGGVQCHPIELTQLDDGSDPSRVSANFSELVEQRKAIAILGAGVPITIAAMRSAAERAQIPVVGGDLIAGDWFRSPYMFPQGGAALVSYEGAYVQAAKVKPGGKVGLLYCVEASICTEIKGNHEKGAKQAGLTLGPSKAVSLTQPDFSAECKLMKDAAVDIMWIAVEGSSAARIARACTTLNYHPLIATAGIVMNPQAVGDKNLRGLGVYLGTAVAPFLSAELPGVAEMQTAMKKYAPNVPLDQGVMLGWSAGKLFEAAMAKVADKARAGDVTTQMVLDGLWQIKDEKLNGMSIGVTFTKGKPASAPNCYFGMKLGEDGFSAPSGSKPLCFGKNGEAPKVDTTPASQSEAATPASLGDRAQRQVARRRSRREGAVL
jgi:branched-chain amino acid transport system substrate-binding protein